MAASQQPHPFHRKIDLQSPQDLQYLRSNIERSAQQKLDLYFPPLPNQQPQQPESANPDPMRTAVSNFVSQFILQTLDSASHSISINGLDATTHPDLSPSASSDQQNPSQERVEYETYDPRLTSKLSSLYAELESLTTQVASLRRSAPAKSAQMYNETLREVMQIDDEEASKSLTSVDIKPEHPHPSDREQSPQPPPPAYSHPLKLDPLLSPSWQSDVEKMYTHGLDELARLNGNTSATATTSTAAERTGGEDSEAREQKLSLTGTMGLVERAGVVVRELE